MPQDSLHVVWQRNRPGRAHLGRLPFTCPDDRHLLKGTTPRGARQDVGRRHIVTRAAGPDDVLLCDARILHRRGDGRLTRNQFHGGRA
jgi:hypothetical protein